ncbi:MAG: diguanylate cyclase [Desulfopila sp.]|jgi:diguanylate cyclase (GGDEF)-like protein|nr:diguanylate cyclase [Desulfopila sp.]
MSTAKILIVDDRPENLFVLESLIDAPDVELIRAASGNEALAKVLDHDFALVLLDVQMPGMDGYEVAELMRGNRITRNIPIIFVTAKHKEQASIFKGYDSGAVDYLFKPLEPVILKGKVGVFLELYRQKKELEDKTRELDRRLADLEELKSLLERTNQQLTHLSKVDGLTGILNRRSFDEILKDEWQRGIRNKQPLSILLADIDYFKPYNDSYGHILGDDILKLVARTLSGAAFRHVDKVARYGGEEFAFILPDTDITGAELMAERVRSDVFHLNIEHSGSPQEKRLTVSVGVATTLPQLSLDPLQALEFADVKLYEAKASGRNCWCSGSFGDTVSALFSG